MDTLKVIPLIMLIIGMILVISTNYKHKYAKAKFAIGIVLIYGAFIIMVALEN